MMTINQLREFSLRYLDEQALSLIYILRELERVVPLDEQLVIYPKNIYLKNQIIELYVFTPNNYLILATHKNNETLIKMIPVTSINEIDYKISSEERLLSLRLNDGGHFVFSPKVDTASSFRETFNEQLVIICRYFHQNSI